MRRFFLGLGILCLLSSLSVVHAQDDDAEAADPAEATIRLMGAAELHERIRTESVDALIKSWGATLEKFKALRAANLLYP